MKKNIIKTKTNESHQDLSIIKEVLEQIHSKITPDSSELEILNKKLLEQDREIIRNNMFQEFKQARTEIETCLLVIKLIKKPFVTRKELQLASATFIDYCNAILGGVKFHCHFLKINHFEVMQGL